MIELILRCYLNWKYRFVDQEMCMCGSQADDHNFSDNHSVVFAKKYTIKTELVWMMVGGRL